MICPKCGAQNIDGVTFCGNCGSVMKQPTPTAPNYQQSPQGTASNRPFNQQPPSGNATNASYSTYIGGPLSGGMIPPKNYMTEAIVVTVISALCCCSPVSLILGIIAIIKANEVNQTFIRGYYDQSIKDANSAKLLSLWAAIVAIVNMIVWIIMCTGWITTWHSTGTLKHYIT